MKAKRNDFYFVLSLNFMHSAQNISLRVFLCGIAIALMIFSCSEKKSPVMKKEKKIHDELTRLSRWHLQNGLKSNFRWNLIDGLQFY